jgi:hypothetical protein
LYPTIAEAAEMLFQFRRQNQAIRMLKNVAIACGLRQVIAAGASGFRQQHG